jgi:hypothetical protein
VSFDEFDFAQYKQARDRYRNSKYKKLDTGSRPV